MLISVALQSLIITTLTNCRSKGNKFLQEVNKCCDFFLKLPYHFLNTIQINHVEEFGALESVISYRLTNSMI